MGTCWNVRFARPRGCDTAAVEAAIVQRLAGLVDELSHWTPASHLSRFNRMAGGHWVRLPPDFAHVIACGLAIARASDGAFDPTIGRLVDLHGYGPNGAAAELSELELRDVAGKAGWQKLAYRAEDRSLRQPGGLALDLSGIAKGHAVDVIADLLAARGIVHALVEIGGELVGRGLRPDGDPWWVDLETPPGLTLPPVRVALHELAVATSGNYRRGAHTIDPRNAHPVDNRVVSVSVIGNTALAADAWATALTVLGLDDGLALADRLRLAAHMIGSDPDRPREILSAALRAMIADA